jgi:signal transduction histidine kinase
MTAPLERPDRSERAAADEAQRAAARERQSHVRHELRAPLAVIYPLLSLLLDEGETLTQEQRGYLEVLERNVIRLDALITGVADSGWSDCSQAPPAAGVVVLGDLLEEIAAMRPRGLEEGREVVIDAGDPPTPRAWADKDDVRQILTGLLRNATTYAPLGGRVTVRVRRAGSAAVTVEVEDTGPGLTSEELDQAFDFGFRGELARNTRIPGLGAGLWVCRELAARNAGDLSLSRRTDGGLRATLTLPAAGCRAG